MEEEEKLRLIKTEEAWNYINKFRKRKEVDEKKQKVEVATLWRF